MLMPCGIKRPARQHRFRTHKKKPGDCSPGSVVFLEFQNEAGKNARLDFRVYSKRPMILSITP